MSIDGKRFLSLLLLVNVNVTGTCIRHPVSLRLSHLTSAPRHFVPIINYIKLRSADVA